MAARLALVLALWIVASAAVQAQVGALQVRVLDGNDQSPLAGATVTLTSDRGFTRPTSEIADGDGLVRFPVLKAVGGFSVRVSMPGFQDRSVGPFSVVSDETYGITVALLKEVRERVEVVARDDLIDLDRSGNSTQFTDEFIADLPVQGRFYQNLLTLAPGVNDSDEDGNPNVHGARDRDFQAQVGGINNADPLTGKRLSWINAASIETLEVLTSGAGAEFGRAQGGFARIVQKQGSNSFEGSVSMIYRSSKFDTSGGGNSQAQLGPEFEWFQPSALFSGPIVKDRAWFRVAHEYLKNEDPINVLGNVEISTRTQSLNADQITWQVTPRNKLSFQYLEDPLKIENFGIDSRTTPEASPTVETGGPTYSVTWSAPFSSKVYSESLLAYQDGSRRQYPGQPEARQDCLLIANPWQILNRARCLDIDSNTVTGSFNENSDDSRVRLTLKNTTTLYVQDFLGAAHRFKVGFQMEDERYTRSLERRSTLVFDRNPVLFGAATATAQATVPVPRFSDARAEGTSWAVYAEDQLKPMSNLTFTLGLRVDREEIRAPGFDPFDPAAEARAFEQDLAILVPAPIAVINNFTAYYRADEFQKLLAQSLGVTTNDISLGPGAIQSQFSVRPQRFRDIALSNTYLSPRFSAAWDPFSNGKTKIAVSAGRYHDKIFLAVPMVEQEPATASLLFEATFLPDFFNNFVAFDTNSVVRPSVSARYVDRDLSAPYQDEISASFERLIFPETSLKVSWVKRKFRDQFQDAEINHQPGDFGRCRIPAFFGDDILRPANQLGEILTDPYTQETYEDTVEGPGDGRIDDCTGRINIVGTAFPTFSEVPDGRPDLYVQNPGWGDILVVGNYNEAEYEAFILELVRRQFRGWEMSGSYTWSQAEGDGEDFLQDLGNDLTLSDDESGFLSYDQRHIVNLSAVTITPWGWRIGGRIRWESGRPYSIQDLPFTTYAIPPTLANQGDFDADFRVRYPSRQRNDERNPSFWTFDIRLARDIKLGRVQSQISLEGFNLLNDQTRILTDITQGNLTGTQRFGRRLQVGAKFAF